MNRDEVRSIAALARIEIPEDQIARVASDLTGVLAFVATLGQLDLAGCQPMSVAPEGVPLREDRLDGRTLGTEAALAAAPERDGAFFLVPPVVENVNP